MEFLTYLEEQQTLLSHKNFIIFLKNIKKLTKILKFNENRLGSAYVTFVRLENSPTALFFFCLLICQMELLQVAIISQVKATFHHFSQTFTLELLGFLDKFTS